MYIADMHCDTIMKIWFSHRRGRPIPLRDTRGSDEELMIDLTKLRKGGSLVQNFAIFVDLSLPEGFDGNEEGLFYNKFETDRIKKLSPWIFPAMMIPNSTMSRCLRYPKSITRSTESSIS